MLATSPYLDLLHLCGMDDLSTFIGKIEAEFEGMAPGTIKSASVFRELPGWSSMFALIIMALAETEYNVTVTGQDLQSCKTIEQLYTLIKSRA